MKCPSCGERKRVRDTRDISYTYILYKGETTAIPAVRGEFCPACGENVLGVAESGRVSAQCGISTGR
jgi:HTH-type transcriptional regulator/antitoxin MqsA